MRAPVSGGKWVSTNQESAQHKPFQVLPPFNVQGGHGIRNISFNRVGRQAQVLCDLLIGPTPGRQHGNGKLGGGKIVCHGIAGIRIMNFAPIMSAPSTIPALRA